MVGCRSTGRTCWLGPVGLVRVSACQQERAVRPDVRRGFRSRGHLLVSAHHATSSRKLLPSPLSPVMRFNRRCRSSTISGAGPTFSNSSRSSIGCRGDAARWRRERVRKTPGPGESNRRVVRDIRPHPRAGAARQRGAGPALGRSQVVVRAHDFSVRTGQGMHRINRRFLAVVFSVPTANIARFAFWICALRPRDAIPDERPVRRGVVLAAA